MKTKNRNNIKKVIDNFESFEPQEQYTGVTAETNFVDYLKKHPGFFDRTHLPNCPPEFDLNRCAKPVSSENLLHLLFTSDCGPHRVPPNPDPSPFIENTVVDCGAPAV